MCRLPYVSSQRDIDLPSPTQVGETPGRNIVATIGINRYIHWPRLTNAVSDARATAALFTWLGFEQVITPLLDDKATGKATQRLVTDDLKRVLRLNDSLVLFYAGHGSTRTHALGNKTIKTGYLIPVDGSQNTATWVELDSWLRAISLLPARHILVILDACHSGIALGPTIKWRDTGILQDTPLSTLHARRSRRVITSALDDQVALDSGPMHGHSLFTGCLIEGLAYGSERIGHSLTTGSELGLYLQQRVKTYPNSQQTPDFGTFNLDDRGELLIPLMPEKYANSVIFIDPATRPETDEITSSSHAVGSNTRLDTNIALDATLDIDLDDPSIPHQKIIPGLQPERPSIIGSSEPVDELSTEFISVDTSRPIYTPSVEGLKVDIIDVKPPRQIRNNTACGDGSSTGVTRAFDHGRSSGRLLRHGSSASEEITEVNSEADPSFWRSAYVEIRSHVADWFKESGKGGAVTSMIIVSIIIVWPIIRVMRNSGGDGGESTPPPRSSSEVSAASNPKVTPPKPPASGDVEAARAELISLLKERTDAGCRVVKEPTEVSGEGSWSFTFNGTGGCIAEAFVSTVSTERFQLSLSSPLGEKLPVPSPSANVELLHCPRVAGRYNLAAKPATPAPYLLASLECDGPTMARHGPSSAAAEAARTKLAARMRRRLNAGCIITKTLEPSMGPELWGIKVDGTYHCIEYLVESITQDNPIGVTVTGPDGNTLPVAASSTSLTARYCPAHIGDYEYRTVPTTDAPYARTVLECPRTR